jgi:hypothetical protein
MALLALANEEDLSAMRLGVANIFADMVHVSGPTAPSPDMAAVAKRLAETVERVHDAKWDLVDFDDIWDAMNVAYEAGLIEAPWWRDPSLTKQKWQLDFERTHPAAGKAE